MLNFLRGNTTSAKKSLRICQTQIKQTIKKDAARIDRKLALYKSELLAAQIAFGEGRGHESHAIATQLLKELESESKVFLQSTDTTIQLAATRLFLSGLLTKSKRVDEATVLQQLVVSSLKDLPHPAAKDILAKAYESLEKITISNELIQGLDSIRYRHYRIGQHS